MKPRLSEHRDEIVARRAAGETLGSIASDFRVSREAIRLVAAKAGVQTGTLADRRTRNQVRRLVRAVAVAARHEELRQRPFPHGTRTGYLYGCGCDECRAANRATMAKLWGTEPPSHGTSGYVNYGCRCGVCAEAHRQRQVAYRARMEERGTRGTRGPDWTPRTRSEEPLRERPSSAKAVRLLTAEGGSASLPDPEEGPR